MTVVAMILRARPGQVGRTGVFAGALNRSDSSGGSANGGGCPRGARFCGGAALPVTLGSPRTWI